MRNFLAIVLALALVFLGAMAFIWLQRGFTVSSDMEIRRVAFMTSFESNDSNALEADGIRIEISEPEFIVFPIPENRPGADTPVQFDIGINNNTSTPVPFCSEGNLVPELIGPDGQTIQRQEPRGRHLETGIPYCDLVQPGWPIGVSLSARLSWQNNLLQLKVSTDSYYFQKIILKPDNSWSFDGLQTGTYQLRFTYRSLSGKVFYFDPTTEKERQVEASSIGQLTTQFVNLRLVQPVEPDRSAVEVDSIRFETLLPRRVLTVPEKKRGAETLVQLGISITNNTPNPLRFSFYAALTPEIVGPDGQILRKGRASNMLIGPVESDFLLAMPGESVSSLLDATLFWSKRDQFILSISAGDGSSWSFHDLDPGTYQVGFTYKNNKSVATIRARKWTDTKLIEGLWTGKAFTPFMEFRLVQS